MANINLPHSEVRVKYKNRILAGSEEKAMEVLRRTEMPPFIPGLNMVSSYDAAKFFGVDKNTIWYTVDAAGISVKSGHDVAKLITLNDIPDRKGFECVCKDDSTKEMSGCITFRYEKDGVCRTSHIPRTSTKFTVLTAKAILIMSLYTGHRRNNNKKISKVLTEEIMRTYTEDPVLALPPAPETSMIVPAEVPNIEPRHALLETPIHAQVEPVRISLEVSNDETIVITPQVFQFMVRQCANIMMSR